MLLKFILTLNVLVLPIWDLSPNTEVFFQHSLQEGLRLNIPTTTNTNIYTAFTGLTPYLSVAQQMELHTSIGNTLVHLSVAMENHGTCFGYLVDHVPQASNLQIWAQLFSENGYLTDFREGVELVHSGSYDFTGGIEVVTRVMDEWLRHGYVNVAASHPKYLLFTPEFGFIVDSVLDLQDTYYSADLGIRKTILLLESFNAGPEVDADSFSTASQNLINQQQVLKEQLKILIDLPEMNK